MPLKLGLWLTLVVVTVHNVEESLTMRRFVETHGHALPSVVAGTARSLAGGAFWPTVLVVTLVGAALLWVGTSRGRCIFWAMVWVSGALLVNGLQHVAVSVHFRELAPGVRTSVALLLPSAVYLFRRALAERQTDAMQLSLSVVVGALSFGPVIVAGHWIATRLPWV
jgi:hypothetical protein